MPYEDHEALLRTTLDNQKDLPPHVMCLSVTGVAESVSWRLPVDGVLGKCVWH